VSDYDYGNARLKAMKSRLLSRRELEALCESGSQSGLTAALVRTVYRKPVEVALTRTTGMDCIYDALQNDLIDSIRKTRSFFQDQAYEMISTALRAYDIHNLKTIFRGLKRNAPAGEIIQILLPIGDLDYGLLAEIARVPGPREAIDHLASMSLPVAQPLLRLRSERPGADIFEIELALEQWHYQQAIASVSGDAEDEKLLQSTFMLDADLTNLLTILRFVHAPTERRLLHQRLGTEQLGSLFVGPGRLSFPLLARAGNQDLLQAALEDLKNSAYGPVLAEGMEHYSTSRRLSEFEKAFKRFRLDWMAQWITKDPLGIGVFLGYLALKLNEVANLHWISRGISLGFEPAVLRSEMSFPG
jgi:V/A-type H+-transporting ATPase subunit C